MNSPPLSPEARPDGENGAVFKKQDAPNDKSDNKNQGIIPHVVLAAMSIACHAMTIGITVYFTYLAFKSYSLFSWHMSCLTIGCLLLMGEAIMAVSQDNVLAGTLSRQRRVLAHWVLQALAAGFVFVGFIVEVINKTHYNSSHFVSAHAILGLVYVILVALANCAGVAALYSMRLKRLVKPASMKLWHYVIGIVTFSIGIAVLITGVYTRFFTSVASSGSQIACTVILVLTTILTLVSSVKSAYSRLKTVCR